MVSALVCMVTHWIRPTMSHDIYYQVVMFYHAIMLDRFSTLGEYWARIKVFNNFNLWWNPNVVIYFIRIRPIMIKVGGDKDS